MKSGIDVQVSFFYLIQMFVHDESNASPFTKQESVLLKADDRILFLYVLAVYV